MSFFKTYHAEGKDGRTLCGVAISKTIEIADEKKKVNCVRCRGNFQWSNGKSEARIEKRTRRARLKGVPMPTDEERKDMIQKWLDDGNKPDVAPGVSAEFTELNQAHWTDSEAVDKFLSDW